MQERNELKARARDEAAAQEARKKKVTVTVDLLGRQVTSALLYLASLLLACSSCLCYDDIAYYCKQFAGSASTCCMLVASMQWAVIQSSLTIVPMHLLRR